MEFPLSKSIMSPIDIFLVLTFVSNLKTDQLLQHYGQVSPMSSRRTDVPTANTTKGVRLPTPMKIACPSDHYQITTFQVTTRSKRGWVCFL